MLTYYEPGVRTELSAVTFANWVDKTANLITDLGHDDGDPIDVALAETHPGHWVSLVWVAAAWQRGCPVNPGVTGAELLVVGPDDERREGTTVACSLHPLGLGFATPPDDAVDFREAIAQPDVHDVSLLGESSLWAGKPIDDVRPRDERLLLADPRPGRESIIHLLLAPVLGLGSTVVTVRCPDAAEIAARENALMR